VNNNNLVAEIQRLSTAELMALFKTLSAPAIADLEGEYAASMLAQPNRLSTLAGQALSNPLMPWQCKAFRPVDTTRGRGYNTFLLAGKLIQLYPMHTLIAPSRYDGQPAYQLVYRYFHSLCGTINMVDEIRQLDSGIYLGIGTWGFTNKQRLIPYPFLLQQTEQPYRGDIGRVRRGFQLTTQHIPALDTVRS
jgi:hypothetical protein